MTRGLDVTLAAAVAVAVTVVVLVFSADQGIHRDEAYYMDAGERYVRYVEDALTGRLPAPTSDAAIGRYWSYNREHPPLMKLLYGLSWRLLHHCDCASEARWHPPVARIDGGRHATLSLLPERMAFRLPTAASFGLLCAFVYLFFLQALGGRLGALAAAGLTFAQPRAFFHAQTASFDLPAATLWFATTVAWWHALRSGSWRSALACGLVFGALAATKLQAFFLPLALGAHWLWLCGARRRRGERVPTLRPVLAMAVLAPAVVLALWPWLWHRTVARFLAYLRFHLSHVHYDFEYLGENLVAPPFPWHEPLGMLVFTAPVVLLVLALVGALLPAAPHAPRASTGGDPGTRALLLFAFFMISDPRSTPLSRAGRLLFAVAVAMVAAWLRFALYLPEALVWALVACTPLVPILDALFPGPAHRWRPGLPAAGAHADAPAFHPSRVNP